MSPRPDLAAESRDNHLTSAGADEPARPDPAIQLDQAEIGALIAALVALGPTASESAASAMRKLVHALRGK